MKKAIQSFFDWGEASETFDEILATVSSKGNLTDANEAQTRFDVIDRIIREKLCWTFGQIDVEEFSETDTPSRIGYVDYLLRLGDYTIVIEAKKIGSSFPSPTRKKRLKLNGSVLGSGAISEAIQQATTYAKKKHADIVIVTNGLCWCYFSLNFLNDDSYASLLFPFTHAKDAETLFNTFSVSKVEEGSLKDISNKIPLVEFRLRSILDDADDRVDRNNLAEHITPALDNALYADALVSNTDSLDYCFVKTEARTKFDRQLGMHLADSKPIDVQPAIRLKKHKSNDKVHELVQSGSTTFAPPVTLIIGSVGVGKSTYLQHFEKISGKRVLHEKEAFWIYIDFEKMGRDGNPRSYLYQNLLNFLNTENSTLSFDYENLVKPAYEHEINALARTVLSPLIGQPDEFNKRISDYIQKDLDKVEPYVDKLFKYITKSHLCVIVLDNIDLYEDEELEKSVFSEGLAFSKRVKCHVIVSIRAETYIKHKHNSLFDAYELRRLWLDPPPFREVLSKRLSFSRKILKDKRAQVDFSNGIRLQVSDLGQFFDIVQKSILIGSTGDFIEAMADLNIRYGLQLVVSFLKSGHIQADTAISEYIKGNTKYTFPRHEIFKGAILGQWKYFKEERAECINLYDSNLSSRYLRLLRLYLLNYFFKKAQSESTTRVETNECTKQFTAFGATNRQIEDVLDCLIKNRLLSFVKYGKSIDDSIISITRCGGFYARFLSSYFEYTEACMFDTVIDDAKYWEKLKYLTTKIEGENQENEKMHFRRNRILCFFDYLEEIEQSLCERKATLKDLACVGVIKQSVSETSNSILKKLNRRARYRRGNQFNQ